MHTPTAAASGAGGRDIQLMHTTYDQIYEQGSSRLSNEGLIGIRYRLPKYAWLLQQHYGGSSPLDVLEIGGGVGEMAQLLRASNVPIRRYVTTEYALPATRQMVAQGFDAARVDAQCLPFADNSFDLVFCCDVMHHVSDPERMAAEMVRVTRRHFFLCEANGLSPLRKLNEFNPVARSLGEKSYFPWTYRSFFPRHLIESIATRPFYVLVPPMTPEYLIPAVVHLSEIGERLMVLNWLLGFSVLIVGQKRRF